MSSNFKNDMKLIKELIIDISQMNHCLFSSSILNIQLIKKQTDTPKKIKDIAEKIANIFVFFKDITLFHYNYWKNESKYNCY